MAGALSGLTVIELAGIGPAPFAGMMLADHGARVVRVDRPGAVRPIGDLGGHVGINRNRVNLEIDLKQPGGVEELLGLVRQADALIEGYRPGVIERLGIGPEVLLTANPRLVVGRMTGWGQTGPKSNHAGHDINYIALSGILSTFGPRERPMAPLNLLGDYGGGGMMLAFGVLAGILSARSTGQGQVIDCAMIDGSAILSTVIISLFHCGMWQEEREANVLDGGAPYYDTYETADGRFVAIGPIEPQFQTILMEKLGLADNPASAQSLDRTEWPSTKAHLRELFRSRTRAEWCALLEDSDACFTPVLGLSEAPHHPHNVARGTFIEVDGLVQPAPAPRFLGTPAPPVKLRRA